ncbi:MAG: PaaI family thioesterase [Oligoflexia bacterium]|nr:PaaI family thioesterase [Oligoflexia bacterium]
MTQENAFQDQGSVQHCYGCGPDNPQGFQIKSYWQGDEAVAEYRVRPHHCAGSLDIVNGGVISTLIDCHSVNLAIAAAYRGERRAIGSEPKVFCVTASLKVTFLAPTPLKETLQLRARVSKQEGKKYWIECELSAAGKVCAKGEVLAVRVPQEIRL